jgi:putative transposase
MAWKPSNLLTLLIASMACWLERQAASQIEYLKAENRALRSRIGRGRILFTDPERRTLGALAKEIGIKALRELDPLVSPATLLRWHRELVAQKWTFLERLRPGRPRTAIDIEQLIARIAHENPSWGYTRIYGALLNLDESGARDDPSHSQRSPDRAGASSGPPHTVVGVSRSALKTIAASDFFCVEVWSWQGLVTHYVLFVIQLATRRVDICGITTNPNEAWMLQMARNLMSTKSGALLGKRHLIVDRDTKYTLAFRTFLAREGIDVIRLRARIPFPPLVGADSYANCGRSDKPHSN